MKFLNNLFKQIGATAVSIQGLRGTGNWATDERPKDFRESILWLNPNGDTPITAFLGKLKSVGLSDPEFSWWEEELEQPKLLINGAHTNVVTTLTVQPGSNANSTGAFSVVKGDILMVMTATGVFTGETMEVSADPTTDTAVPVTRGVAGTTGAAIADGAYVICIGSAFAEGTGAPTATNKNPTKFTNYAQIFKTAYELSNTADKTTVRTGNALQNDKKRQMFNHSVKLEMAYLFGRAYETTGANGKPKRFTGGLFQFLQNQTKTFVKNGTGADAWTEDNFIDAIAGCFNYTADGVGNERVVLCGNGALTALNKLARNSASTRVNFDGVVEAYGMKLQRWILPQGTIYLRTHPLFNTNPVYQYAMLGLNLSGLRDRYLRKHTFQDNIQAPDSDTKKGQWIGETGLELNHPKTHFVILNCGGTLG